MPLITECCKVQIADDWRYCPRCGLEARVRTEDLNEIMRCGHRKRFESIIQGGHSSVCQMCRVAELEAAIAKVWAVASGEKQVAMDDTQGMEWITDYLSSVYGEQKV